MEPNDEPQATETGDHFFIKDQDNTTKVIFVKPQTGVHPLAARITALLDDGWNVATRSMGAGSTNQAVKAWAVVRQRYSREGKDILVAPYFQNVSWHSVPSSAIALQGVVLDESSLSRYPGGVTANTRNEV